MTLEFWRLNLEKVYPKISLPEEHKRQSQILASRFATRLGMSEEDYISSLPEFPSRPDIYDSLGLNIPVIVETRLPWKETATLSGISFDMLIRDSNDEISDYKDDGFQMPDIVFAAWAETGDRFLNKLPLFVRRELLEKDENRHFRLGRILDGIALYNARPDLVMQYPWTLLGTNAGPNQTAEISPRYPVHDDGTAIVVGEKNYPVLDSHSLLIEGFPEYKRYMGELVQVIYDEPWIPTEDTGAPLLLGREIGTKIELLVKKFLGNEV